MSVPRRVAARLLRAVVQHSSPETQEWANAMLRELDFIESDWAALLWALGSTSAIFRHAVPRAIRAWFRKESDREAKMEIKNIRSKALGMLSGAVLAALVVACAFGLVWLSFYLFPAWGLERMPLWLVLIVLPEIIFIGGAVALWRKRKPMAVGILLSATILATHVIVHVASHGLHP
jgi:hypothetical protein